MEPMIFLERAKGGAERTRRDEAEAEAERESGGSPLSIVYDGDSADHELSKLMSSLERQFGAFDDDEGTLDFMGKKMNMAEEESSCQTFEKENVVSDDRNVIRRAPQRLLGSVQVSTTSRPIDFNRLASIKPVGHCPSSSLYNSITTVLKENVSNRAEKESQIVDDFWSTEMEKKISAVARRKLLKGIKPPAQVTKPKDVERGGGNSRTLGRRRIRVDLRLDADKVFEWDHEILAEKEVPPSTRAYSSRPAADSPSSLLPGTELSPGHSPPEEVLRNLSFLSSSSCDGLMGGRRKESGDIQAEVGRHNCSTLKWKAGSRTSPRFREGGDLEAAPPRLNSHQNNPLTESSPETDGKQQKRAKRRARETRYNLEGCGSTWKKGRRKSKRIQARETQYNLEGCGSTWKEGRRKSQRIRVGPLEWWRGEKVLYAVHDSLMTIVGISRQLHG